MKTTKILLKLHYLLLNILKTPEEVSSASLFLKTPSVNLSQSDFLKTSKKLEYNPRIFTTLLNLQHTNSLNVIINKVIKSLRQLTNCDYIINNNCLTTKQLNKMIANNVISTIKTNIHCLSNYKYLPINFIKSNINNLNIYNLSCNVNLTPEIIINNIDKNWNWTKLIENINLQKYFNDYKNNNFINIFINSRRLTESVFNTNILTTFMCDEYLQELMDVGIILNFYNNISSNLNISTNFIEKYINENWNFNELSKNTNLNLDFINKYYTKLNIENICKYNKNININFIEKHNLHRYAYYLSDKNIPFEYISQNIRFNWNYNILHRHSNIPVEFIAQNINENWNWIELSVIIENNQYKYKNLILSMINKIFIK